MTNNSIIIEQTELSEDQIALVELETRVNMLTSRIKRKEAQITGKPTLLGDGIYMNGYFYGVNHPDYKTIKARMQKKIEVQKRNLTYSKHQLHKLRQNVSIADQLGPFMTKQYLNQPDGTQKVVYTFTKRAAQQPYQT